MLITRVSVQFPNGIAIRLQADRVTILIENSLQGGRRRALRIELADDGKIDKIIEQLNFGARK